MKIRVLEDQRRDIDTVGKLTVASTTGQPVRIDSIAKLNRGFGPTRITRTNRQFSISFSADVAPGHALDEASNDVRALIADLHMPPGYGARMQGQTRNLDETTDNLIMAIALASIFVYMVLAAQFESFVQPIIIWWCCRCQCRSRSSPFATGRTLNLWSSWHPPPVRHRQEELHPAGGLHQYPEGPGAVARGDRAGCPDAAPADLATTLAIIAGLLDGAGNRSAVPSARRLQPIVGGQLCLFLTLLVLPRT